MKTCVRIGFGKIARIHEQQLSKRGIVTIGIVETDPMRRQEVRESGFEVYESIEAALTENPDFFDVCVPSDTRLSVISALCALNPFANILIEKPLCRIDDVARIKAIFDNHRGKVSINENYATSNITKAVRAAIDRLGITPNRIIIESTKHRGIDFLNGRYVDNQLGAIGYEGSHLLAIIKEFGHDYNLGDFVESSIDNMILSRSDTKNIPKHSLNGLQHSGNFALQNQGSAHIRYRACNGCLVDLYTSMSGRIGFPYPPYAIAGQTIALEDTHARYRMLCVEGKNASEEQFQVVGFYEPIPNLARSLGRLAIYKNSALQEISEPLEDNTMLQHLSRILEFFDGNAENPYSVESALADVIRLNSWMGRMNQKMNIRLVDAHHPDWTHFAMSMTKNYFLWMNDQIQHTCDFSISDIVRMPLDDYIASASNDICPKDSRRARFYLLVQGITPVSMGGWRILPSGDVEIVRVYTNPEHRGHGHGRLMLKNLITECRQMGFRKIKLDTGCFMKEAQSLYRSLGFVECSAYEGAEPPAELAPFWLYMELDLAKTSESL